MDKIRLDKWLWAARFYKTRSLAVQEIGKGARSTVDGAGEALLVVHDDQVVDTAVGGGFGVGLVELGQFLLQEKDAGRVVAELGQQASLGFQYFVAGAFQDGDRFLFALGNDAGRFFISLGFKGNA